MLFCRVCMNANTDGWDECPICGTGNMAKQYLVRFTLEVPVVEFSEIEAIERAVASATGNIMEYLVGMEAGELDLDNDEDMD